MYVDVLWMVKDSDHLFDGKIFSSNLDDVNDNFCINYRLLLLFSFDKFCINYRFLTFILIIFFVSIACFLNIVNFDLKKLFNLLFVNLCVI